MSDLASWSHRPAEESALMNPAFMGAVVHQAVRGFEQESGLGLPFPLAFLVPPVVLVESNRSLLPRRKDSSLAGWLQDHPEARLRFAKVAASLVPVVREGLVYAASAGVLSLAADRIYASRLVRGAIATIATNTREFQDILRKAHFTGRWYANAGTTETIMALWGVRP